MKRIVLCLTMLVLSAISSAQLIVKLKIEGVEKDGGKVYISIFDSESRYKDRSAYLSFSLEADKEDVTKEFNLPIGQYVFSIYQDTNGNGKLDTNLIGIPKEKFGFTNYDGKSVPGSFFKHKIEIKESRKELIIRLYNI